MISCAYLSQVFCHLYLYTCGIAGVIAVSILRAYYIEFSAYLPLLRGIFWYWHLSLSGSSFFFMNSFINLWHLNYILHHFSMLHTLYIHQRYQWICKMQYYYPIQCSFQHPVLKQSQSGYSLNLNIISCCKSNICAHKRQSNWCSLK